MSGNITRLIHVKNENWQLGFLSVWNMGCFWAGFRLAAFQRELRIADVAENREVTAPKFATSVHSPVWPALPLGLEKGGAG